MKRLLVFLCVSALVFAVASPLMAGGIDNKTNFSAEWVRTLNRNAATDSADAVVYNPAGVVKMEDGLYVSLSGQYAFKDYSNTAGGTEYESDKGDFVPGLFALYRKDKWAGYAAFTIPCGGGSVEYSDGNAMTNDIANGLLLALPGLNNIVSQKLEAKSFYYGYTVGGAYAVNDMVSVSLGVRYLDATRELEGSATLNNTAAPVATLTPFSVDYEETGDGWGGIVGVNLTPTDKFNIGIRYETKTNLNLKTKEKTDDVNMVPDGAERSRDLPALLGLGVSHQCTPNLKSEVNLTYYLNDAADWDNDPVTVTQDETDKDNGYDVGIAVEYTFMPQLKGSLGYMYTNVGIDADDMSMAAPELDAHSIAGGFVYEAMPGLNLNFGILKTFYQDDTSAGVKLEKDVIIVALGVQYKFW